MLLYVLNMYVHVYQINEFFYHTISVVCKYLVIPSHYTMYSNMY